MADRRVDVQFFLHLAREQFARELADAKSDVKQAVDEIGKDKVDVSQKPIMPQSKQEIEATARTETEKSRITDKSYANEERKFDTFMYRRKAKLDQMNKLWNLPGMSEYEGRAREELKRFGYAEPTEKTVKGYAQMMRQDDVTKLQGGNAGDAANINRQGVSALTNIASQLTGLPMYLMRMSPVGMAAGIAAVAINKIRESYKEAVEFTQAFDTAQSRFGISDSESAALRTRRTQDRQAGLYGQTYAEQLQELEQVATAAPFNAREIGRDPAVRTMGGDTTYLSEEIHRWQRAMGYSSTDTSKAVRMLYQSNQPLQNIDKMLRTIETYRYSTGTTADQATPVMGAIMDKLFQASGVADPNKALTTALMMSNTGLPGGKGEFALQNLQQIGTGMQSSAGRAALIRAYARKYPSMKYSQILEHIQAGSADPLNWQMLQSDATYMFGNNEEAKKIYMYEQMGQTKGSYDMLRAGHAPSKKELNAALGTAAEGPQGKQYSDAEKDIQRRSTEFGNARSSALLMLDNIEKAVKISTGMGPLETEIAGIKKILKAGGYEFSGIQHVENAQIVVTGNVAIDFVAAKAFAEGTRYSSKDVIPEAQGGVSRAEKNIKHGRGDGTGSSINYGQVFR